MNKSASTLSKPQTTRSSHFVTLLFLAVVGFVAYQVIPTYFSVHSEKDLFRSELAMLAGHATVGQWEDRAIIAQVMDLAKKRNFTIQTQDIQIQRRRGQPDVSLHVTYARTEQLLGRYEHDFRFQASVQPFEAS